MTDLQNPDPQQVKDALKRRWKTALDKRVASKPSDYFPWHEIQEWVFDAPDLMPNPVRVVLIVGGNRSGKSKLAMGMLDRILRRDSKINDQLLTTDKYTGEIRVKDDSDPLRVWVVPPTGEKFREDWVNPADGRGLRYWMGDRYITHKQSPDYVFIGKPPGVDPYDAEGELDQTKCDRILGKSQDQDLLTFEASEVDVAIFDEEPPDPDIVTSTMMRIATSNGVIIFAFTPLRGLSWSYERWWKPLVKQGKATKVNSRRYIYAPEDEEMGGIVAVQMGMADNPRAENYAKEVMQDPTRSDAEKAARVLGEYGFVEGALLEKLAGIDIVNPSGEHKQYVVDELPDPHQISQWYLVADPNKSYGAVLSCIDNDGNLFFVAEHLEESWPNRKHAEAFRQMEYEYASGRVERYADPGSAGAQSVIDLEDFGMFFDTVEKGAGSVSRSIKRLRGLAWPDPTHEHPITGQKTSPRVYFYRPGLVDTHVENGVLVRGSRLAEQISQARQKEDAPPDTPDKTSKQKLDLFDCARYTADIAISFGPHENDSGLREKEPDRLKRDDELLEDDNRHIVRPFTTPEYSFDHL